MNKQKEFDKLFLKQNEKIDKDINKEWEDILFSEKFLSLYEKIDNIFDFEMNDKDGNFYQGEDDRYVLEIYDEKTFHAFQIYFKDRICSYELHDAKYDACTPYEALCDLPTNQRKLKYLKDKIDFLSWDKENKEKVYKAIINQAKGKKRKRKVFNMIDEMDDELKTIKGLKW